jgi:hypothetical protein
MTSPGAATCFSSADPNALGQLGNINSTQDTPPVDSLLKKQRLRHVMGDFLRKQRPPSTNSQSVLDGQASQTRARKRHRVESSTDDGSDHGGVEETDPFYVDASPPIFPTLPGQLPFYAGDLSHGLRGAFHNTAQNCYLSSVLQALLHTDAFLAIVRNHSCAGKHTNLCCACLLQKASAGTDVPGSTCNPEFWCAYLNSMGMIWSRQHDPVELLQIIADDLVMGRELNNIAKIKGRRQIYVDYPCQHLLPKTMNEDFEICVMELLPGDVPISLLDLIVRDGNSVPLEYPPCQCSCETTSVTTSGITDSADLLLFSISRQVMQIDYVHGRRITTVVDKNNIPVFANDQLSIGDVSYTLRAIIEHIGLACNSGHYIAHVRAGDGSYIHYNDSSVSWSPTLDVSILKNARLYVYERSTVCHADEAMPIPEPPCPPPPCLLPPTPLAAPEKSTAERSGPHGGQHSRSCMPRCVGQDRVETDSRELLRIFTKVEILICFLLRSQSLCKKLIRLSP